MLHNKVVEWRVVPVDHTEMPVDWKIAAVAVTVVVAAAAVAVGHLVVLVVLDLGWDVAEMFEHLVAGHMVDLDLVVSEVGT